jgi:ABC-type nitrate/sulfonate/bicarbonate transport system ATPase subunit
MTDAHAYTTHERLLTLDQVCVRYDRPILEGVTAHVDNIQREGLRQGQVVCLLGPSGIGKSQLFRCIAGLQRPTSGSVRLNGSQREVQPGEVGVVAQDYPLFNHRTVWGNLMLAATRHGRDATAAGEACAALLEKFGMMAFAKCHPMMLSGGQRQRVAIAQQLLCSSHFLLMDEPFSGLDPLAKNTVCETLIDVSTSHELNTIIVVTHDIESAIRISDTLWLLGRHRDAGGQPTGGAAIQETHDLAAMGLAWDRDIESRPEFRELATALKARFATL